MSQFHTRLEVMSELAKNMDTYVKDYLVPIETNWQPADMLPDATKESFFSDVKALQEAAHNGVRDTHSLQQVIRRTVGQWVSKSYRRRPMIIPLVIEA